MGRGARERAALRELQRLVWGDSYVQQHVHNRARRRDRFRGVPPIVVGAQLIVAALWLALFAPTASAHTNQISISCTKVTFAYTNFPDTAVISHESILIDRAQTQKDFTFQGPEALDTIMIDVGPGSHSVSATSHWSFNGQPQGSAEARQLLSDCGSTTTTTTVAHSTTTLAATTTTPSTSKTSTTIRQETSTTISQHGTTSTTMSPTTSTTLHTQGSTTPTTLPGRRSTTSTTLHGQGSTSPTTIAASTPLALTGTDDGSSVRIALAMIGVGLLAAGLARRRSPQNTSNPEPTNKGI